MPKNRSLIPLAVLALVGAPGYAAQGARVAGKNIRIEFDSAMHSRVIATLGGRERVIGDFTPSEFLRVSGNDVTDFSLQDQKREPVRDRLGSGFQTVITGTAPSLKKTVTVTVYDQFPRMAFFEVSYTNTGKSDLSVAGWTNQHYAIRAPATNAQPAFWSYQSGSYEKRPDWVLPLKPGFQQENYLGMNAPDYGGGTPVIDVWSRDAGIGVGHLEMAPKLVSLPVTEPEADRATVAVEFQRNQALKPGATLKTFRTFAAVHQGDYFQTLLDYRAVMIAQGVHFDASPESAFGPIWCAWGYGRKIHAQPDLTARSPS